MSCASPILASIPASNLACSFKNRYISAEKVISISRYSCDAKCTELCLGKFRSKRLLVAFIPFIGTYVQFTKTTHYIEQIDSV